MDYHIFIGRQPILDREGKIFAYELLYRNSEKNSFPNVDPEQATVQLLINTYLTIGVDKVVGTSKSFINFTGELLTKDLFRTLKPGNLVVEILEDIEITPVLIDRLREIKAVGFQLALDDFVLHDQYAVHKELFELIDYIKVDFLAADEEARKTIERFVRNYPHIRMLAEKIETEEQYKEAIKRGYELFQGYFFARPEIVKGVDIPSNLNFLMDLMSKLNEPEPNIDQVVQLILRDISLTYKLLRLINLMHFGVPKTVSSVKQAIVLIGFQELRKWIRVMTLQEISDHSSSGRVQALVSYSMTRARMCELLAIHSNRRNSDEYFFVGLFSLLDILMQQPWVDILPRFPFSEEVADTLTGEETAMKPILDLAIAVERFDWDTINYLAERLDISKQELSVYSLEAHRWTNLVEE